MIGLLMLFLADAALGSGKAVAEIHWMRPQVIESPDRRWAVVVPHVADNADDAPVRLVNHANGKGHLLWRMGRSAEVSWRPDSKALLIVERYPERSSVALVEPGKPGRAFAVDVLMHRVMDPHVPKGFEYYTYQPEFVGWDDHGAAIVVVPMPIVPSKGGSSIDGECRVFHLAAAPARIVSSERLTGVARRKFCR